MTGPLLTLQAGAPACFTRREKLAARDVRRGAFALWASSVEEGRAALGDAVGLCGVVVTPGPALALAPLPGGLFHLTAPANQDPAALAEVVEAVRVALQAVLEERDRTERAVRAGTRATEELQRSAREFAHGRANLVQEIAERRAAETALRRSQERVRVILDSVHDALFVHEPVTGAVLEVNRRACELFGYSAEELCAAGVADLSAGDREAAAKGSLGLIHAAARGEPQTFEWRARDRTGREFWVEVTARRVELDGAERVLVTGRDINERKAQEAERRQLEQQVLHSQKLESLGVLAGGIAHDFNNLLSAILGNTDLALRTLPPAAPACALLEEVDAATQRAADLCRQLLAYAGKGRFVLARVDLSALVTEMGRILSVSISKKAALRLALAPGLPLVDADATQLRQVVMNLIVNASEAIGDRPGTITVTTGVRRCERAWLSGALLGAERAEGEYAFLEVADDGCGMTAETQARIFEPFFSTKFAGRGLGLSALLGIVRSHGGAVAVRSEPGKGTSFTVVFPAAAPAASSAAPTPSAGREAPVTRGVALVVDDEEAVRGVAAQMLRLLGFTVRTAADGREALRALEAGDVSCVLLDLTMPELDGAETLRELRRRAPRLPVVLTSGYTELEGARLLGADPGPSAFLQKPFRLEELRERLERVLRGG